MIDTLRLIVGLGCNLSCSYCCNNIPEVRARFKTTRLEAIEWNKYGVVCITSGEPLMYLQRVLTVLEKIPNGKTVVLYTNGNLLSGEAIMLLYSHGVTNFSVGIHTYGDIDHVVKKCCFAMRCGIRVRFFVNEKQTAHHQHLISTLTELNSLDACEIKRWRMNDCFRENEDIVMLLDEGYYG